MGDLKLHMSFFLSPMLLFLFISSKTHLCSAVIADTISAGQSLTANQTIVSKNGNFELGFFTPGKSLKHYVGIWFKKAFVGNRTVVWVANRDHPIIDQYSSELKLLQNGSLVILNKSKIPIWSTNSTSRVSKSSELVLGDDGNLVLRDGSNSSVVIWQSFDHPTDTWFPGAKLKYDNITKKAQKLVSWKNSEDPSPGLFSLELKPDSGYVLMWNGSQEYWTSGVWDGQGFSLVPEMRPRFLFNFTFESNENESYFTYDTTNKNLLSRLVIDISGQIKQLLWLEQTKMWNLFFSKPLKRCDVYAYCGPFGRCNSAQDSSCQCLQGFKERSLEDWNLGDPSGGCVRKTSLQCGNRDRFFQMPGMKSPVNSVSFAVDSVAKCKSSCLSNCSCNAYAYSSTGCSLWFDHLLNIQQLDSGGDELYIRVAPSEVSSSKKKSTHWPVIVGAIAGALALFSLVLILIWTWRKWRPVETSKKVEGSLTAFTYRDLQIATKNFSERLGSGAFGSVFKGVLSNSTLIAVKKLEGITQGEKQFRAEVSTIGTIQHVNLVRLRGFCSEGNKRLLVYDHMENRSLNSHLFREHEESKAVLDWKTRYNIAIGTARGLAYLHEECRDCIIHCDIKPENILLDADLCPKVADFGLAKLIGREFSRVLTTMRGTRGYLAPEWISGVAITAKADVYSYGMMLFEIISGRRNLEQTENGKIDFFPTQAAKEVARGGDVRAILDSQLEGNADTKELTSAFRAACWCIQEDEIHRPTMGQVVQILEGFLEARPPPMPRSLQLFAEGEGNIRFFSESSIDITSFPHSSTISSSTSSQSKASTGT
ncbi:hypothetical protein Scep_013249 [Stephania cephalantha]|uniref:Receptor-like serine/threonine-protein kinase n=1 Tax=Stephania cephalantha TaxID=152367 RepID=A0AAP0PAL6_9MAGN